MAEPRDRFDENPEDAEGEDFDAKLERIENELGERLDKQAAEDPLLHAPPKRFPIPEVLRESPRGTGKGRAGGAAGQNATGSALARLYAIGTDFGVTIVAGIGVGWAVDHFAKSSPWGILIGLLLGFLVGGYRFFKEGMAANREALEELRKRRG